MSHSRLVSVLAALGSVGALVLAACWVIFGPDPVDKALSSLQSLATITGIVVGGYWTYTAFIRERVEFVRLAIAAIEVDEINLAQDGAILHTHIRLQNTGKTKFSGTHAELRIRQILPVSEEVREFVRSDINIVASDKQEAEWPCIAQRNWSWDPGDFDIEPSEHDTLHANFGLKNDVAIVEFYFFLGNPQKPSGSGWTETFIYRIKKRNYIMGEKEPGQEHGSLERQQKQQKPQKPQKPQQSQQPDRKPPPDAERPQSDPPKSG